MNELKFEYQFRDTDNDDYISFCSQLPLSVYLQRHHRDDNDSIDVR